MQPESFKHFVFMMTSFVVMHSLDLSSQKLNCRPLLRRSSHCLPLTVLTSVAYSARSPEQCARVLRFIVTMEDPTPPVRHVRFGVFDVDLQTGELRRKGIRIRLQEQPFQILQMLLEHPGEVVSRDDIEKRLWSANTFVDFNHGLNRALNKLREALGDHAENPQFIETIPRRGYRFIAQVRASEVNSNVLSDEREVRRPSQPDELSARVPRKSNAGPLRRHIG